MWQTFKEVSGGRSFSVINLQGKNTVVMATTSTVIQISRKASSAFFYCFFYLPIDKTSQTVLHAEVDSDHLTTVPSAN